MPRTERMNLSTMWAPAKVNLYLHVGPESGGMHPVDSLVMFTDSRAADRVTARKHSQISFAVEGATARALKGPGQNLVQSAAMALRDAAGTTGLGAELTLYKELPVAGGVGGGSSDAAATLHLLNEFWNIRFGSAALEGIAVQLGADVPACVRGRPVVMRGIGDLLDDVAAPNLSAVLVNPGVPLETRRVFERFDRLGNATRLVQTPPPQGADAHDFISGVRRMRNDLEEAARDLCPEIGRVIEALEAQPGCRLARMSGSGPTCFGLFDNDATAEAAAAVIADRKRRYWVRAVQLRGA